MLDAVRTRLGEAVDAGLGDKDWSVTLAGEEASRVIGQAVLDLVTCAARPSNAIRPCAPSS
jgi:hypothetical protein